MQNNHPLHLLITRPGPRGLALCEFLAQQGFYATHWPTIEFVPPENLAALEEGIQSLDQQDWIIFISPQAVIATQEKIHVAWPILPSSVKLAAVGAGTAQTMQKAGFRVDCYPAAEWNSEGLLSLPAFQHLARKKIALIKGLGGRELLSQALTARGSEVTEIIAYRRELPNVDRLPLERLLTNQQLDLCVAASGETVHNLKILLGENLWPKIKNLPLIVVSQRIKCLAEDLDFQTIWVASNASDDAILDVIVQKRNEIWQMK